MSFEDCTLGEQYASSHYANDLLKVRDIIQAKTPEYLLSFDLVMNSNSGYFTNMFVTRKNILSDYCQWLFAILFELEKIVDISTYDAYQSRIFGFLSERLFNVWLHDKDYRILEAKTIMLEDEVKLKKQICQKFIDAIGI